ncbi:MAG: hypothetical protein P8010_17530 [Desulfosarcinaceae bacterium]|jgi:hypothetical protein
MLKSFRNRRPWVFWSVALLILSLEGCAAGRYGKFVYDEAVDKVFEDLTVLPDHRYYITGPDSRPDAIIAIDQRYTLKSKLWKPVEMTPQKLKHWVANPARRAQYYPYPYGRYIVSDDGQRIGLWYSLRDWRAFATVKMLDDTTVQVSTPLDEGYRMRRTPFSNNLMDDD